MQKSPPPTGKESPTALKEGWLHKQGNFIRNWRSRWFQLKAGILLYYKDPSAEHQPTNYFLLAGSHAQPCPRLGDGVLELMMANGERRYMMAAHRELRDAWVQALTEAAKMPVAVDAFGVPSTAEPLTASATMTSATKPWAHTVSSATVRPSTPSLSSTSSRDRLSPEDFVFLKVLGKGNYGKVMLATRRDLKAASGQAPVQYYAIKVIKKSSLIDAESLDHVLAENRVLQHMQHPYLVQLYYSFQTKDRLYFVMEYVRGGELFFHLGRERRFTEERVRFYAAEIISALHYLHSKGIVYRDMKLENLLLDHEGHIKVTDFGLCKEGISEAQDTTKTFCGTPEYLAPEILEDEHYGRSVDWWALGVVLYELMVGRPPFHAGPSSNQGNIEKLFQAILRAPIHIPSTLSAPARSLLEGLLERDPTKRLGCGQIDGEDIMSHAFFAGIKWEDVNSRSLKPPFVPVVSDAMDVRNFDREFTDLPAVLTPTSSSALANAAAQVAETTQVERGVDPLQLSNFTFIADAPLRR